MTRLTRRALMPLTGAALTAGLTAGAAGVADAAPAPNKAAPPFAALDTNGDAVELLSLKGKTVVLEWTNHDCPYVRKHYRSGNMQALQKDATENGVVWISIISSAPGRQGYVEALEANAIAEENGAAPSHIVRDPGGEIGKLYAAVTTPHMFVINPAGEIVFMGGIDDKPTADMADISTATNYVRAALDAVADGRTPEVQSARPYGCSIKYGA